MVLIKTAPYGDWKSSITAEAATAGSRVLTSPRVCPETGRSFFLEQRGDGTTGIAEITPDGPEHILAEEYSASTTVYEYGGLAYTPVPGGLMRIIFSDSRRQSLNLLDVDDGTVETLVQSSTLRYADFDCHPEIWDDIPDHSWVLAIEEDHADHPTPDGVENRVVAINLATRKIQRLLEGADFYSYPRFSPDGTEIAWLQWNHPNMPFTGVQLYMAEFNEMDGSVSDVRLVAGDEDDSIAEPRWSPDGDLFFGSDKSGYRQLCRIRNGQRDRILLPGLEKAEFGDAHGRVGCQSYVFLTENTIVAAPVSNGEYQLVLIDLSTQDWTPLDLPLVDHSMDCLAAQSSSSLIAIGSGCTTPLGVYTIDILDDFSAEATLVRSSSSHHHLPETIFSIPQPIRFTTLKEPHREVHGFFFPPHNPRFVAPPEEGELPPLIVNVHGGGLPTMHASPGLDMMVQYFTSRGYAYLALNCTGSSGHGKAYRDAIFGNWGELDQEDAAEAVEYLAWSGRIDRNRVGIEGVGAGAFSVLCCLAWNPHIFAGGVCTAAVSDVRALGERTHKLESRYVERLLGLRGKTEDEKETLFRARSPLYHAQRITPPLLLVHGDGDTVAPVEQSEEIQRRVEKLGGDVRLVVLEGEGHIFARADSRLTQLVETEKWFRKTLLGRA